MYELRSKAKREFFVYLYNTLKLLEKEVTSRDGKAGMTDSMT
jgi:hypothetical protein